MQMMVSNCSREHTRKDQTLAKKEKQPKKRKRKTIPCSVWHERGFGINEKNKTRVLSGCECLLHYF